MGGELSFKVKSVYSDRDFVRPSHYSLGDVGTASNDLSISLGNNEYFHICGNNDWAFLALELLRPIKDEANKIMESIKCRKSEAPSIKAVMLGKNDKRIMDVYFGGKDKCNRILGLPVIVTDELNEVKFLVEDTYLPFS